MRSSEQFDRYLQQFRQRLQRLNTARGVASICVCALAVTLLIVTIAIRSGFPDDLRIAGRLILFGSVAAVAFYFFVLLKRRLDGPVANEVERRSPAFGGRVEAFQDTLDPGNPIRELLAEQALDISRSHTPESQVRAGEFRLSWSLAAGSIAALLLVAIVGSGNYSFGVRDLWVGWAFPGLLPPQSIEVTPGDDGIRLGGTVRVRATMQGFDPADAHVHAQFGDDDWQQVPMSGTAEGFEFTFFSVRQPLQYYVSAANVRSPTFNVRVVDLPVVENLALTLDFPDWTGRDDEIRDPGGDVRAIAETEVEVRISTDRAMTPGVLIVDDREIRLNVEDQSATARFTIENDGQYYVAAAVGGERIRLTDDFFVTVLDDQAPSISFARPGRDWSASRIEEVTTRVSASDDYRIESLKLRYSVNGSDWQELDLDADADAVEFDHVFFLESLDEDGQPLEPGDLISYYAIAEDHENSAQTDMFFVDVQPFDKRYSQSQQAGGSMGGQQGGQQDEISQRQREIIISTWNLIRERDDEKRGDDAYVSDNSALLTRLQRTLKDQVDTLVQRTQARQLTVADDDIARFVEHLQLASEAMAPAADRLQDLELNEALLPEQEALRHLLAAEAVFNDISVSLQANNRGGGGGGNAGRDLAEMFELEMDLEKNQYETGSVASPNAPEEQMQEAADELEELARRQEQLARNQQRSRQMTPEQRWQQEMLRRDVEELQRRLEEMSRQGAQGQAQAGNASGQPGQSGEPGQPGSEQQREMDELRRRLESATRAMNEADEAMRNGQDPESLQRAMDEATRQLEAARNGATEAEQRARQAAIDDLAERADDLYETQADIDETLQAAVRRALADEDRDPYDSGMTWEEEKRLADEKREVLAELQALQQQAQTAARDLDDDNPRAASELRDSVRKLQDDDFPVEQYIAATAAYIEQGDALRVATLESAITEALRQLGQDLERVGELVGGAAGSGQPGNTAGDRLARALSDARDFRRGLQGPIEDRGAYGQRADQLGQDVNDLLRQLGEGGMDPRDLDELRRLAAGIRSTDFDGNEEILAREARQALSLAEQLELALARAARRDSGSIYNDASEDIPEQHREIVADYFRKLGQTDTEE